MIKKPSLKINAISNSISLGINVIVAIFLTPFILRYTGKTEFGIWSLALSFVGFYGLLNMGVDSAVQRYMAKYIADNDDEAKNFLFNTSLIFFVFMSVVAILFTVLFKDSIVHFFEVEPSHYKDFSILLLILGFSFGVNLSAGVFTAALSAKEKYVQINITKITVLIVRVLLIIVFLSNEGGLIELAGAQLISSFVSGAISIFLFLRAFPEINIKILHADFGRFKNIATYGGISSIIAVGELFRFNFDSIVVGKMIGMDDVAIYAIAGTLIWHYKQFIISAVSVLVPRFSSLDSLNEKDRLNILFIKSLRYTSFFTVATAVILFVISERLILWWVGDDFHSSVNIFRLLVIAYVIDVSQAPSIGLLFAINKHSVCATLGILEGISNLVISLILVKSMGLYGVALGTAIPMIFFKIIQIYYVVKYAKIPLKLYLAQISSPIIAGGIILISAFHFSLHKSSYTLFSASTFRDMFVVFISFISLMVLLRPVFYYKKLKDIINNAILA